MNHLDMVNHLVNHPEFMQHFRNLQALRMATPDQVHNFALHMAQQNTQPPDLTHMQQLADWHKGVMQQIPKESYLGFTPPKPPQPQPQGFANIPPVSGPVNPLALPTHINIPAQSGPVNPLAVPPKIQPPQTPQVPQVNAPGNQTPETFNIVPRVR